MQSASKHRRGFTIVEVLVATALTVFLAYLLSTVWAELEKSTVDLIARGQLMQEMDMAVAALSRDLGGSVAVPASTAFSVGTLEQGRWIAWDPSHAPAELWLCFDGGTNPDGVANWSGSPDTVIRYYLDTDSNSTITTKVLVRQNVTDNTRFIVARNLSSMSIAADGQFIDITLTFVYQRHGSFGEFGAAYTRTVTLKARAPQ